MFKTPRLIVSFTLPFFIALIFMLSVFTYSMGDLFSQESNDVAYVLGTTSETLVEPEVSLETTTSAEEVLDNYISVVTNADGTRVEVYKDVEGSKLSVKIVQYDMFGDKVSEKAYEENLSENNKNTPELKATKQTTSLTHQKIKEKLEGIGYSYNNSKVSIQKTENGDVYKVSAVRSQKLFGIFKINLPASLYIKSSDGNVQVNQSFFTTFLDFLSK